MATSIPAHAPSDVLLALLVETGGLALIVTLAGISDSLANIMIVLMVGEWILCLVNHTGEVTTMNNMLNNILKVG